MKSWRIFAALMIIAGLVVVALSVIVPNYQILRNDDVKTMCEKSYYSGKVAGKEEAQDGMEADLISERDAGYKEGYDVGFADGADSVKEERTETSVEKGTTSSSSTSGSEQKQGYTVYITDTGSKYHRHGCRYLRNSSHAVTLSNAKSLGYTPCSVCNPPS